MAVFLFTTIISMTAAGGSFLYQQFGIHKAIGGGIIAVLIIVKHKSNIQRLLNGTESKFTINKK